MNRKASVRAGGFRGRVVEHAVPWRGDHKLPPVSSSCGRSSSSYQLTFRGIHVTTYRIPWEHAAKWSLPSKLCNESPEPRMYRDRSWHHVLPGNLSQSTMNGLEENNDLAFEKAVLSMVSIKRDLSVTENTS
jgi:hypothetical protein